MKDKNNSKDKCLDCNISSNVASIHHCTDDNHRCNECLEKWKWNEDEY